MTPEIVIALMTLLGTLAASWFSYRAKIHALRGSVDAREANDAVNRTHPDHPRIYDLALENKTEIREIKTKVSAIETKVGAIATKTDNIETQVGAVETKVGALELKLLEHPSE